MAYSRENHKGQLRLGCLPLVMLLVGIFCAKQAGAAVQVPLPEAMEVRGAVTLEVARRRGPLVLDVQPEVVWRARTADKSVEMQALWDGEGAKPGPYLASIGMEGIEVSVWGREYRQPRWADGQGLVALVGTEHEGPRLRVEHGTWGFDHSRERTGVRWERVGGISSGGEVKAGVLVVAGQPPSEPEDNESDWGDAADDEGGTGGEVDAPAAESARSVERGVLYGTYQGGAWRLQGALAGAVEEEADGGLCLAQGVEARYASPGWRVELKQAYREAGYAKSDAPAKGMAQWSVTRANGRLGAKVSCRSDWADDAAASRTWVLSVGGRAGMSVTRLGALYTQYQVKRVKSPAWRVHLQWKVGEVGCSLPADYPWLWPDRAVQRWQGSVETLWPLGVAGGLGVRICVAEAKNGRLNWSYPLFGEGKALTMQSHSALKCEALWIREGGPGRRFLAELMYAEEVKHNLTAYESPRATYWAWRPSWERELAERVKLTLAAGVLMAQEYSGAHVEEVMHLLQLKIVL
ncbi:MAG: hypothetical protein ACOX4G_11955 [Limnochordia bacterium]